jgi:hypothetical protein
LLIPPLPWAFALGSRDGLLAVFIFGPTGALPFDPETLEEEVVSEVIKFPSKGFALSGLEDAELSRFFAAWDICWTLTISDVLKARAEFEYPTSRNRPELVLSTPGPIILDAASIISAAFLVDI